MTATDELCKTLDVHEIKLNLRYPNSRQEDITDAFMRGYQGAVKIGNDAVRRVKAEKTALERRIDELCQENERLRKAKDTMRSDAFEIGTMLVKARDENAELRADQAHWELGNCPSCPNVVSLQEALEQNAKLRELVDELYPLADYGAMDESELDRAHDLMRVCGIEVPS